MGMRAKKLAFAMTLIGGLALLAARAEAGFPARFLEGTFIIENDANDPNSNNCFVESDFGFFDAGGSVQGIGTAGQIVRIDYEAIEPTSVGHSETKISVKQGQWSTLNFFFDGVSATGQTQVEKCSINGSVNGNSSHGSVSTDCKGDDVFGALTANQVASVQAAFNGNKFVKVKVNTNGKGSLSIKCSSKEAFQD
jgi:hypothetical protein